jgi:hypothetical protein
VPNFAVRPNRNSSSPALLHLPPLGGVPRDPVCVHRATIEEVVRQTGCNAGCSRRSRARSADGGHRGYCEPTASHSVAPRALPQPVAVYVKPPIVTHRHGLRALCRYIRHSHVHAGSTLHLLDSEQGVSSESFCHTFYDAPSARADATHPRTPELRARHANAPLLI